VRASGTGRRRGAVFGMLGALGLFSLALFVSRLVDLGGIDAGELAPSAGRRSDVDFEVEVLPASGGPARPLARSRVEEGDQLRFRYGPTRYLYLWVVRVLPDGTLEPLIPNDPREPYGRSTARQGELVPITVPMKGAPVSDVVAAFFFPIPRRLEELREAAARVPPGSAERIARELPLTCRRFLYRLEVAPRAIGTGTAAP
jgi:hypothetical protein